MPDLAKGHDVVVIGASAGGLEPLKKILAALPEHFPASIFVVLHVAPSSPNILPSILSQAGVLPAEPAVDGTVPQPGRIYVAQPDRHLLVKRGRIETINGPRENRSRPAIDPTLRSAAKAYGSRVIAVLLSGGLNDGTYGAMVVKSRGGRVIVQDPAEADCPDLPGSALEHVEVDHVLPVAKIGPTLIQLTGQAAMKESEPSNNQAEPDRDELEEQFRPDNPPPGKLTPYVCTNCGGPLWQVETGSLVRFRCHTGHIFTADVLVAAQSEEIENALWSAVRIMDEHVSLLRRVADSSMQFGSSDVARRHLEHAVDAEHKAALIRKMLLSMA